jgi:hypothetical protein
MAESCIYRFLLDVSLLHTSDTEFAKARGRWCNGKDVPESRVIYLLLDEGRFPTLEAMKQVTEVEEKLFTSSLNMCPEDCCRKGWGGRSNASPSHHHLFHSSQLILRYLL